MTIATQSESRRKPAGDQLVHPPPLTAETQAKLAELRQRVEQLRPRLETKGENADTLFAFPFLYSSNSPKLFFLCFFLHSFCVCSGYILIFCLKILLMLKEFTFWPQYFSETKLLSLVNFCQFGFSWPTKIARGR